MKNKNITFTELSASELESVSGGNFFFDLGAFFGQQANINDSVRRNYGNTAMNHYF